MSTVVLPRDTNQALGIGEFAIDFLSGKLGAGPSPAVLERTRWFHTDSALCGLSALALRTNAPTLLRAEALQYGSSDPELSAFVFGSNQQVMAEKAVVANSAAVREWDSNGTNFGYRPELGHCAGEFGHNDFYPVVIAACQQRGLDGATALRAMALLDEIRGRLAEVFSLKSYKIDHVVHGAIGSAATYGALMGATAEQIESAIGMFVAHHTPWRAIRAGKQLSDSKGASAAISSEAAVLCVKRSMAGFLGPRDIFRNPEAIWRFFEPTTTGSERWSESGDSPFDLHLSHSGDEFAVMGMHFKLGLYEHQSAGAIQGLLNLILEQPKILQNDGGAIQDILIRAYEPAFGIIGNPMKREPRTRQSADHSMVYIICTLLRKAIDNLDAVRGARHTDDLWTSLMLDPHDYHADSIFNPKTKALIQKVRFEHGGQEYDARYPDGIPTSIEITASGQKFESGLVMYPGGHARNTTADLKRILDHKFALLAKIAFPDDADTGEQIEKLEALEATSAFDMSGIYDFSIAERSGYE